MSNYIKKSINRLAQKKGFEFFEFKKGIQEIDLNTIKFVSKYTMTSHMRILALIDSVKYITKYQIQGSIVECGVWKGGSIIAIAKTLLNLQQHDRDIYLFDTFEGMTKPAIADGKNAQKMYDQFQNPDNSTKWNRSEIETVKKNIFLTNYNKEKFHFIKGKVEDTLPDKAPNKISLLRLDTDFYESTLHELTYLFPRLVRGGILIIDDYGYWQGSKKAVDEYFEKYDDCVFLNRIDSDARIAVKL